MTRIRTKVVDGTPRVDEAPIDVRAGGLRANGICRHLGLPRAGVECPVLEILEEGIFSPERLVLLEQAIRRELSHRSESPRPNAVAAAEKREDELAHEVTDLERRREIPRRSAASASRVDRVLVRGVSLFARLRLRPTGCGRYRLVQTRQRAAATPLR